MSQGIIGELNNFVSGLWNKIIPPDSFLGRLWWFLTTPGTEMGWYWRELVEVGLLVIGMTILVLYMMGARGKIAKCLYWVVALFIVLKILF